jgi:polar amino acid transport system substrate-binding protein
MHRPDNRIADLAENGRVRIGVFPSFQYGKNPITGEPVGLALEIASALASRLGLGEVVAVEFPSPAHIITSLNAGVCDLGFMNILPGRKSDVYFTRPFVRSQFTYLVPAGSSLRSAVDADATGIRIAAVRGHASTAALLEVLDRASPLHVDSYEEAVHLLKTGGADAFASIRHILFEHAPQSPGSRVLDGAYGRSLAGIAVARGNRDRVACISEALHELKQSGLLQRMIENLDLRSVEVVAAICGGLKGLASAATK